ncbi:MAG TPA: sn-glycerol-3-phosphate ABC transporter ATP-binding protein UgpC [Candidatus Atribacteria bacterium]|jgi:multiple sugar transport system ATP-binding protein|nr:sn-glycerol-3-phosphate ABC transporter ATP-binding protein UgpC [Candidatus Atribacteria bacterium]
MANVSLKSVVKRFGEVVAVNKVDLDIADEEFLVLVGPSGCGKTTTLRMIAGLEEVDEGEIYIDDILVNDVPPKDRDIAMVFQNYALYPHMDVYNNMAFGLKLRKFPKDEIDRRVKEAADILGIHELLNRKPKQLSGGQRQRVAVGRAIVRHPKVFLFDEPLSNLDAKLRVQMRAELSKLHDRLKATMIYVTHDQIEAMTMGDRIVVMKDGIVQQVGTPLDLYNKPQNKFVAGFIGTPSMNFLDVVIKKEGDALYLDGESFKIKIPAEIQSALLPYVNKEVTLGIRPQDIYDCNFSQEMAEVDGNVIETTVDIVEPLGSEQTVYLVTGPHVLVAQLDMRTHTSVGDTLKILVDTSKIHLFDVETEQAIV